jgi:mono/diheme cytochrome c family protein
MWWTFAAALAQAPEARTGMAGHFERGALTMLAVAVGDTEGARLIAKQLARDETAPANLRAAARDVSRTSRLERAAPAVGVMAQTCAECHVAGARGPVPQGTSAVPGETGVERHIMAAMFIWIGLVTPLDQPYQLGLDELLPPVDTTSSPELQALAALFSQRVTTAREAKSWDERTVVFGEMLQVCSSCHLAAKVTP